MVPVGGAVKKTNSRPTHPQPEKLKTMSKTIVNTKIPAPRFTAITLKDTENTRRNINPFYVQKALDQGWPDFWTR
jgi:hypothetical protein